MLPFACRAVLPLMMLAVAALLVRIPAAAQQPNNLDSASPQWEPPNFDRIFQLNADPGLLVDNQPDTPPEPGMIIRRLSDQEPPASDRTAAPELPQRNRPVATPAGYVPGNTYAPPAPSNHPPPINSAINTPVNNAINTPIKRRSDPPEHHCDITYATFACNHYLCHECRQAALFEPGLWGMRLGGWLQTGGLYNPDGDSNTPVLFNDDADDLLVNQFYLFLENPVQADGTRWDFGGRFDLNYGTDSRFITVPGLERHVDDTPKWNSDSERYGVAIPQAYAELAAPLGHGFSVKAGHFYSITGFEAVPAPQTFFYSRSYSLVYGRPFTHTGVLASFRPAKRVVTQLGLTRGWDAWNNGADTYAVIGRLAVTTPDQRTTLSAAFNTGQDVTPVSFDEPLTGDRHLVNLVLAHRFTERTTGVLRGDFGYQEDGSLVVNIPRNALEFDSASWGGIASYLFHEITPRLRSAVRLEWFNDRDQSRLGIPVAFKPGGPVLEGGNYYAITAGLNFAPGAHVLFRPELRWDWSDLEGNRNVPGGRSSLRAFNDRTSSDQFTAGADLVLLF